MKKIILSSAVAVFLLTGCGEDKNATSEAKTEVVKEVAATEETKNQVAETANNVVEKTAEVVKETANEVVEKTKEAVESGNATVETVAQDAKEVVEKKIDEAKEATAQAITNVVEATTQKATEVKEAATEQVNNAKEATESVVAAATQTEAPSANGELLFKACASCHGQKAEKQALGKSQVIAGWDKQKLIDAMNGYKDGSYGGAMKGIMKGQVATKTDAEIEALATFISNL